MMNGWGGKTRRRRPAAALGHGGDARGLQAAVGIDPAHDGNVVAHLVRGDGEYPFLLLEGARGDLGGAGVDGDRRKARHRDDVAQVLAKRLFVDLELVREGKQAGGNDAVRP